MTIVLLGDKGVKLISNNFVRTDATIQHFERL